MKEKAFLISLYVLIAVVLGAVYTFGHRWNPVASLLWMPAYVFIFAIAGALLLLTLTLDSARLAWALHKRLQALTQVAKDDQVMKDHDDKMKALEPDQRTPPPVKEQNLNANLSEKYTRVAKVRALTWDIGLVAGLIVVDLYLASIVGASWWASGGYECKFDKTVITAPNSVRYGDHGICSVAPGVRA